MSSGGGGSGSIVAVAVPIVVVSQHMICTRIWIYTIAIQSLFPLLCYIWTKNAFLLMMLIHPWMFDLELLGISKYITSGRYTKTSHAKQLKQIKAKCAIHSSCELYTFLRRVLNMSAVMLSIS